MKRLFISLILGIILFSLPVFSTELYQYNVNGEIFNNNSIHYTINLIFVDHVTQSFSTTLLSANNIHIDTDTVCDIQEKPIGTEVSCEMKASQKTLISIEYDSTEILMKKDGYILFSDSYRMFSDTDTLSVIIKLPEGSGLKKPIENSFSPTGALKGSDGRRTILSWEVNDLKEGDRFDTSIAFEKVAVIISNLISTESVVLIVLVVAVGFIVFYRFYIQTRSVKLILPILKDDEKKIFNTLLKHGSGVKQNIVVKDSGYSKAKVSKVLNSLRERGIIKLERIGRSNKVYIERNFQKKA